MHVFFILISIIVFVYIFSLEPSVYRFEGSGPLTLVIAGTHGDEPAPSYEIEELVRGGFFKGTNSIVIPCLNPIGRILNSRTNHFGLDINRGYSSDCKLRRLFRRENLLVEKLLRESDIVIDFHEANSYHRLSSWSLGNTFTPSGKTGSIQMANKLCDHVNEIIPVQDHKYEVIQSPSCRFLRYSRLYG